jgi:hypothetical protein
MVGNACNPNYLGGRWYKHPQAKKKKKVKYFLSYTQQFHFHIYLKELKGARCWWLTSVIPITWEVVIRRIVV